MSGLAFGAGALAAKQKLAQAKALAESGAVVEVPQRAAASAAPPGPAQALAARVLRCATLDEARAVCRAAADADGAASGTPERFAGALPTPERLAVKQQQQPAKGSSWPETIECYLGPTNSGKTYRSLDFLAEQGSGCYAGPLRALAWEVRDELKVRCAAKWGDVAPSVGLWTGEESEDVDASIVCCTSEVAPCSGAVLVLDEVHWCIDPWRGQAWTRLLLAARSGQYRHVRIAGPSEAEPLLRDVFRESADRLKIIPTTRRSRLHYNGTIPDLAVFLRQRKAEGRFVAIVAFSRAAVLALAGQAQAAGSRASVIFGKLPPEARRTQLDQARSGALDVIVTTDVIGHGVNLPLDDVVFAETSKFDGETKRPLKVWEAAQVAGRAGRGDKPGHCWLLPKLGASAPLVRRAVALANGDASCVDALDDDDYAGNDLVVDHAIFAPDLRALRDLCGPRVDLSTLLLPNALKLWTAELARTLLKPNGALDGAAPEWPEWVRGSDFKGLIERLDQLSSPQLVPADVRAALSLEDVWNLARLPIKDDLFAEVARAVALGGRVREPLDFSRLAADALEDEVQRLGDILVTSRRFPHIIAPADAPRVETGAKPEPDVASAIRQLEALYLAGSLQVGSNVQLCIDESKLCTSCKKPKGGNSKPSDKHCRQCFLKAMRERQSGEMTPGARTPGTPQPQTPTQRAPQSGGDRACYNCGETGHVSRECPRASAGRQQPRPTRLDPPPPQSPAYDRRQQDQQRTGSPYMQPPRQQQQQQGSPYAHLPRQQQQQQGYPYNHPPRQQQQQQQQQATGYPYTHPPRQQQPPPQQLSSGHPYAHPSRQSPRASLPPPPARSPPPRQPGAASHKREPRTPNGTPGGGNFNQRYLNRSPPPYI
ncbi:P-loop containing nucleoside triphosphate hydrolase protein [Pelagophyceae sp. CCMP2097]|nr:P-loop containing nucleoside triphosphate hydrolase protein [Pelagophyceae sp. CCMP2097]